MWLEPKWLFLGKQRREEGNYVYSKYSSTIYIYKFHTHMCVFLWVWVGLNIMFVISSRPPAGQCLPDDGVRDEQLCESTSVLNTHISSDISWSHSAVEHITFKSVMRVCVSFKIVRVQRSSPSPPVLCRSTAETTLCCQGENLITWSEWGFRPTWIASHWSESPQKIHLKF